MDDFKPTSPAKNKARQWYADVLVDDFVVPFRSIIVPKDLHWPDELYSRSVRWHEHDALLQVRIWVRRVALAHDKVNLAPWVTCTANVPVEELSINVCSDMRYEVDLPFVTVDDDLIALLFYGCPDVRRIRRGNCNVINTRL